ncbi:hypothetical protein M4S82_07530 [Planococcus sp. MERTA32b]|nr:hypothetical protein [Planococcus sp. MER TA 32b]
MKLEKITNNVFFELATVGVIILTVLFFTAPLLEDFRAAAIYLMILSFVMSLLLPKRDLRLWILIGWALLLLYAIVMILIFAILLLSAKYSG